MLLDSQFGRSLLRLVISEINRHHFTLDKLGLLVGTSIVRIVLRVVLALRLEEFPRAVSGVRGSCRARTLIIRQTDKRSFVVVQRVFHALLNLIIRGRSSDFEHVHDVVRILTVHLIEDEVIFRLPRVICQANLEQQLVAEPFDQKVELVLHLGSHAQRIRLLLCLKRRELPIKIS